MTYSSKIVTVLLLYQQSLNLILSILIYREQLGRVDNVMPPGWWLGIIFWGIERHGCLSLSAWMVSRPQKIIPNHQPACLSAYQLGFYSLPFHQLLKFVWISQGQVLRDPHELQ